MTADQESAAIADDGISAERLREAEEYVQQEEGAGNRLTGWVGTAVIGIAIAMTLFHLYAAYDIVPTQPLRYIHVAFVLLLSFMLFPMADRFRNRLQWFDVIPALAGIVIILYALWGGEDFTDRATVPDRMDVVMGAIFIVLVLEAARRTTGPIMPIVAILFIAYAMLGPHLPPPWTHRGFDIARLVGHLFITLEGIFGVAVDVSGRPYLVFRAEFARDKVGTFDTELVREWFQAFAMNAGLTLHVETLYGSNDHHIAESCFKGLARALRAAFAIDLRNAGEVPSTKGVLG